MAGVICNARFNDRSLSVADFAVFAVDLICGERTISERRGVENLVGVLSCSRLSVVGTVGVRNGSLTTGLTSGVVDARCCCWSWSWVDGGRRAGCAWCDGDDCWLDWI